MTIAEAGSVGGIKHNFSVMVRGVGFSTLIISSTSQSRPLSHPPASLSPRARAFLSIFRFRYRYTLAPGNTFPCIFLGHSPRRDPFTLLSCFSSVVRPCASTVCSLPYPTTFVVSANPLFVSLCLSVSLLRAFSPFFLAL